MARVDPIPTSRRRASGAFALLALAAAGLLASCRGEPAPPRTKPLPPPDERPPLLSPEPRSPRIASYRIDASYDATTHRLTASERLTWKNTSQSVVRELPFHLYLNAFKNETTVFMRESHGRHRREKVSKRGWGWIEVKTIAIGNDPENRRSTARYPGPDETVLELPLDRPVAPGETIEVTLEFEAQLPEVFARTGYKREFAMVAQWFPKIGVLVGEPGRETWHCKPFHLMSEFFADFGNYDVSLTVPDTHVVAATGVLAEVANVEGGRRRFTFRAEDVHDFSWMIDPHMERISGVAKNELGDVEVRVYFRPEQREFAERHLRAGIASIEIFSRLYVPYPWAIMTIIDPPVGAAGAGGMEYPTLVTTGGDSVFTPVGVHLPEFVTVHEVGHNWFQGILASNEVEEAWLDEGINEYADGLVMAELFGEATSAADWNGLRLGFYETRRALGVPFHAIPDPIATPSYRFVDFPAYGAATYAKTALAMRTLENIYGARRFAAAMKAYAQRFAFGHPEGRDLWATLERELGDDLSWFVEPAFHGTGVGELGVRDVRCWRKRPPRGVFGEGDDRRVEEGDDEDDESLPWLCEITVVNLGEVAVPVDVDIEFEDGSHTVQRWGDRTSGGTRWHRIEIEHSSRVAAVTIDPQDRALLNDSGIDASWRATPDSSASRRAAARAQFWTQTLMQLSGL